MIFSSVFRKRPPPLTVFVEGNIGAGKSKCIYEMKNILCAKRMSVLTFVNDVDTWRQDGLLADMDDSRLGRASKRAFQTLGCLRHYIERAKYVKDHGHSYDFIIHERHPSTTLRAFKADACVGRLFFAIDDIFRFMAPAAYTVYLRTDVRTCEQRVKKRHRAGERNLTHKAFVHIEKEHESMMNERTKGGGVVFEVETSNLSSVDIANMLCDLLLQRYSVSGDFHF